MLLLSPKSRQYLISIVQYGAFLRTHPYGWDTKKGKFTFDRRRRAKLIFYAHNLLYNLYMFYVFIRWIQSVKGQGISSTSAIACVYVILSYQSATAIQLGIYTNYGEHHHWLNDLMDLLQHFEETRPLNGFGQIDSGRARMLLTCHNSILRQIILVVIICFLDCLTVLDLPESVYYVTSLLPKVDSWTWWQLTPFASFHWYIFFTQWSSLLLYQSYMLCHVTGMINILHMLKRNKTHGWNVPPRQKENVKLEIEIDKMVKENGGDNGLAKKTGKTEAEEISHPKIVPWTDADCETKNFAREYRKLEILQTYSNKMWSTSTALYESLFICGAVLGFYGAVKQSRTRSAQQLVIASFFTYTLLNIWQGMGALYETSSEVLRDWNHVGRRGWWFPKFLKSAPALRVNIGEFFYADREIKLTILAIIFERTTSLLLT